MLTVLTILLRALAARTWHLPGCWRLGLSLLAAPALLAVEVDVYILAGQSNMEGRADRHDLPPRLQGPQQDVLFYHNAAWTALAPGSSRRPAPPDGFGPELSFGRALADQATPRLRIALIKHAVGGTSLSDDWEPRAGRQSVQLLEKVRHALAALIAAGHSPRLRAFVWMQGERDAATREQAEPYADRLRAFIGHMRSELKAPALPFIIGRITPHSQPPRPFSDTIRAAQQHVAASVVHTILVDTDDLTLFEETAPNGQRVRVHFDAASLVTVGERLAAAARSQANTPSPPAAPGSR